jgi:type I restriction enzyme, R subunit
VGKRYLIEHSAGSGKSKSIAWLTHQLIGARKGGKEVFDSIIVITDRRILDQQIEDEIKSFAQVSSTVDHAEHSGDLRRFIESGMKIIISTGRSSHSFWMRLEMNTAIAHSLSSLTRHTQARGDEPPPP